MALAWFNKRTLPAFQNSPETNAYVSRVVVDTGADLLGYASESAPGGTTMSRQHLRGRARREMTRKCPSRLLLGGS